MNHHDKQFDRDNRILTQKVIRLQIQLKEETRKKEDYQSELIQTIKKYEDEVVNFTGELEVKSAKISNLEKRVSEKDKVIERMKDSHQQLQYQLDQYSQTIQSYERKDMAVDQISKNEKEKLSKFSSMVKEERDSQEVEFGRLMKEIEVSKKKEVNFMISEYQKRSSSAKEEMPVTEAVEEEKRKNIELTRLTRTITYHQNEQQKLVVLIPAQPKKSIQDEVEEIVGKVLFQEELLEEEESEEGEEEEEEEDEEKRKEKRKQEVKKLREQLVDYQSKFRNMLELNAREKRLEVYSRKVQAEQVSKAQAENSTLKTHIRELQTILHGGKVRNVFHSTLKIIQQIEHVLSREAQGKRLTKNRLSQIREKNEVLLDQVKEWTVFPPKLCGMDLLSGGQENDDSKKKGMKRHGGLFSSSSKKGKNKIRKKRNLRTRTYNNYGSLPSGVSKGHIRRSLGGGSLAPASYKPVYFKATSKTEPFHRRRNSEVVIRPSTSSDQAFLASTPTGKGGLFRNHSSYSVPCHSRLRARKVVFTPGSPKRGGIKKALAAKKRRNLKINAKERRIKKESLGFTTTSPRFDNPKRMYIFY